MTYKETSHGLHFLMTLLTGGFWILVWIWRTLSNSSHNRRVQLNLLNEQLEELKRIHKGKNQ